MAFRYTNVQYTEMVRTLAVCGDNVALACRTFNERFGTRVDNRTMLAATQRLRDHGSFRPNTAIDRGDNVRARTRLQDEILDYFDANPHSSTREAAPHFNVSHLFVWRTLRGDGQHPYHLRRCQELTPGDYLPRIEFSRWLLDNWQRNIIWTRVRLHVLEYSTSTIHICGCTKILLHAEWTPSSTVSRLTSGRVLSVHTF